MTGKSGARQNPGLSKFDTGTVPGAQKMPASLWYRRKIIRMMIIIHAQRHS